MRLVTGLDGGNEKSKCLISLDLGGRDSGARDYNVSVHGGGLVNISKGVVGQNVMARGILYFVLGFFCRGVSTTRHQQFRGNFNLTP